MDFKAIISNFGEEKVYVPLSSEVERRLPATSVEWKRSYGRSSKQVVLQASFLKFDSSQLDTLLSCASNLESKPLLHVFWTSCLDNDNFKSSVRNHISRWQRDLQEHQCSHWLIVHVVNQETVKSAKSMIQLPRSSVFDKIKMEFGQKMQDRCIQLWEPDKETLFTKSGESWELLLAQLRHLLLESFGQYLDTFEDKIRSMREKYAQPNWSFIDYFVVHEELALIFQSIMLKEDALVQYDEVDALLSQFVINCTGKEPPKWLRCFCDVPFSWDGVNFSSQIAEQYKTLVKSGDASLLDFRNYLFSRQCKLLIKMKRRWEIPSRFLGFLHTVAHELKLLKISLDKSMIACWVILSCMHVFQALDPTECKDRSFYSEMARLHDYMLTKLHVVGHETGLYYLRGQTERERASAEMLLNGFGKYCKKDTSPVAKLKKALTCSESFGELFVEVSRKCSTLFAEINYRHSAMNADNQLASFFFEREQYSKADTLLELLWPVYKIQKWERLCADILIPLAECKLKQKLHEPYLNLVGMLACMTCLAKTKRLHYSSEFIRLLKDPSLSLKTVHPDIVLTIDNVTLALIKGKGHIGDVVSVYVHITLNLSENLVCDAVSIDLKYVDLNNPNCFSEPPSPRTQQTTPLDIKRQVEIVQRPPENTKEPLTPSNLLKRIKSHRRTWSRNKNIIDGELTQSNESVPSLSDTGSITILKSGSVDKLLSEQLAANQPLVKRNLFSSEELLNKPTCNGTLHESTLRSISCDIANTSSTYSLDSIDGKTSNDGSVFNSPAKYAIFGETLKNDDRVHLHPGRNKIKLSARITSEGRFSFNSIHMQAFNVNFTQNLNLSHGNQSFFIVADPPKVTWTSSYVIDYLLTGSKQRLHVTILNGPGVISDGAVLRAASKTGLVFSSLKRSDITIFPLERDGQSRQEGLSIMLASNGEALLVLPECQPYERINVYFDVIAPNTFSENTFIQHEINFVCDWLKEYVNNPLQLECMFYKPFKVLHKTFVSNAGSFVKVTLRGVNSVQLIFSQPQLILDGVTCDVISPVDDFAFFGNEQYDLVWRIPHEDALIELKGSFHVKFKSKVHDEFGCFSTDLEIDFHKPVYNVDVRVKSSRIVACQPVEVEIFVTKLHEHPSDCVYLMLDPANGDWRSPENHYPVNFELQSDNAVVHVSITTASLGTVAMPTFILTTAHAMVDSNDVTFDLLSPLKNVCNVTRGGLVTSEEVVTYL